MRTRSFASALLLLAFAGSGRELFACGDKFLVVGRGTRFQRAAAPRGPAAILVYANPATNLPKAFANVQVDAVLRKAGYRPTSVSSADELDSALRQSGWDLVLIDAAAIRSVLDRLQGGGAPAVLPVMYNATAAESKQAAKQYPLVLNSPTKNQAFLETIDEALALGARLQTRPGGKGTS